MAGHSKWSQIKRKKAVNDQQRGKIITKHIRAIQSAIREGGSAEVTANVMLKNALAAAKTDNVPQDNINRAIERAVGGGEGNAYESVTYEGYAPAGVAVVVEALTDNRNRTAGEVRSTFGKYGGNMSGGTAWQFEAKGIIELTDSETAQELAIELGADDMRSDDDGTLTVYTSPTTLYAISEGLQTKGFTPTMTQVTKIAQNETNLSSEDAAKVARMIEALEDLDDVQNVYSSANLENLEVVS
ncbi:MAG: YebC/PmpR family DNA-binding transcriptional regulator [Trueperaceae bacterium]